MDDSKCESSDDGKHQPDWTTVRPGDGVGVEGIMDVWCKRCGKSGSIGLSEKDIAW